MREYDREEEPDEYYDDYVDEEEEQEEGGEEEGYEYGEEEEEEEEERKPTREEMEYLELRARLKESIRKQMKREHGSSSSSSQNKRQKLPYDNYGSFFGPSQPVIAQRVIQESKSLLENSHLASKIQNAHHDNKKSSTPTTSGSKPGVRDPISRVTNELKTKVQKLKDTRDYSFLLSDDAETSNSRKEPPPRTASKSNSETRLGGSADLQMKRKQPPSDSSRHFNHSHEERKPFSRNGQMHSKVVPKLTSASKLNSSSVDPRKQLGNKSGNGPGRPVGPKGLPLKKPVAAMEKNALASSMRNSVPGLHKPSSSKFPSSAQKQHLEHTRGRLESNRGKIVPKQPLASSRPQTTKPLPQSRVTMRDDRPKKKPVQRNSESVDAIAEIRKLFKYNPNRYADDDDVSDMEANFDDIMREEKRSARIAKKEDEEELRKIEEEEEREEALRRKRKKLAQR